MTTTEIIKAIETKTGIEIDGDHDRVVLALGFLSNDKMRAEITERVRERVGR